MTELGTVRSYADVCAAMRARVVELGTNYDAVDVVAGFTTRFTSKLLSPSHIRTMTPEAFDALLGTLGLEFVVRESPEALQKASRRLEPRKLAASILTADKNEPIIIRVSKRRMKKLSKLAAKARKKIPAWKRSAIARNAIRARWRGIRPANRAQDTSAAAAPR